jgi:hypothetical protein
MVTRQATATRQAEPAVTPPPGPAPAVPASARPAPKAGRYIALTYLSIGRADGMADRIDPGDPVDLTEEQAAGYLDPKRFRTPPIVLANTGHNNVTRPLPARALFGQPQRLAAVRPDPAGSSGIKTIMVESADDGALAPGAPSTVPGDAHAAPEASDPQPGSEGR